MKQPFFSKAVGGTQMTEPNNRATPLPYSPTDKSRIMASLLAGEPLICPPCEEPLKMEGPVDRGDGTAIRAVTCPECGRSAILTGTGAGAAES